MLGKFETLSSVIITLFFMVGFWSCDELGSHSDSQEIARLDSIAELYHKGKIEACLEAGMTFIGTYPKNDKAWHLLSSAALKLGHDSLSETFANNAIRINSRNHIALLNIGILLDKKGNYEEAGKYYEQSLDSDSSFLQTYSNYAGNRLMVNDFSSAVQLGEKAVLLGDKIEDKAILCISYHRAQSFKNRDALFQELTKLNYKNIADLEELMN